MNKSNLNDITIPQLKELFKDSPQIGIGDDFQIINIEGKSADRELDSPFRFNGLLLIWCISGRLRISVNLNEYDVEEDTLFLCVPGNIVKLSEVPDESENIHYVCVAMTRDFASSQKVDVQKLFTSGLSLIENPGVRIGSEEACFMAEYLGFMKNIVDSSLIYRKEAVQSLWASVLYIIAGCLDRRKDRLSSQPSTSRSRLLFKQFINLVAEHHTVHRNVGFYAEKLCLTPKYLSRLIKEATGKSAPDWIDAYVILDAKNLLKYSNDTIKEIVYKLNFPNQSVFYKFFKARTGMTPSEYRNS